MAITTLDQLIAGLLNEEYVFKANFTGEVAGQLHSAMYLTGRPGAAAAPSPGLAGAALTSYAGQIPFPAAVGGKNIHLVGLDAAQGANIGGVILADRLWHNSGLTVTTTTAQTVNSAAFPARDENGTTNGESVLIGIEVSTATTNASPVTNTTMSYTNQAGTAGQTGTISSFPATAVAGTFVPFNLAAGDTGVRSVQSVTLGTSYGAGAIHLVAYRVLAMIGTPLVNVTASKDAVQLGMPRCYDSSVPFMLYRLTGTAAGVTDVNIMWAQG